MVMGDDCELLFFDTFSHDSCEELNLDLVQFPFPVYIFEIRVVPLGTRVQADFPGGYRLGATNPSSFKLEFFVNDLSKRSASTFEKLGSLEYKQNVDIQFPVPNKIPTDGLVLRGWYSAVTLAVYGVLAKTTLKERSSPPPPPPPQVNSRTPTSQEVCSTKDFESPVADGTINDWERNSRIPDGAPEPPPVRSHSSVVDTARFGEITHQQPEQHVAYPSEIPSVIGTFSEPPPPMVYQDCVPVQVAQVPGTSASYGHYDANYPKSWHPPDESYQSTTEQYDHQLYNRPSDTAIYQQPTDAGRQHWDSKDHHGSSEVGSHEHENYGRASLLDIPSIHRDKDKERSRDRAWDRDMHDYKDGDIRSRDHDSKRKDRGRRSRETSWERTSSDVDRYRDRDRDRDRNRESGSRDRDRDRDRNRDRSFFDRNTRKEVREVKRPTTPPSPRKTRPKSPQTPPEDKITSGPRTPKEDEPMEFDDRNVDTGLHSSNNNNYFEPIQRERIPGEHMYNLSEGEIQEGDNTEEDDGYEEIVSEEEDMSDGEERVVIDMNELDYELGEEIDFMSLFSPYNCELQRFQHFADPTLFPFEIAEIKLKDKKEQLEESNKAIEAVTYPENQPHDERWVEFIESINEGTLINLLEIKDSEKFNDIIDSLIKWVIEGLDFDLALQQPQTAYKVRHLKAGIRLATLMFQTNTTIIEKLLKEDIPQKLLQLFDQPYMVLPVKLLILRAIDSVLSTKPGISYVVHKQLKMCPPKVFDFNKNTEEINHANSEEMENTTCYQKLLQILMSKQLTRAVVSLTSLINKIHFYEMLVEFSDCVDKVIQCTQLPEIKSAPPEESADITESAESGLTAVEPDLELLEAVSNHGENLIQVLVSCLQEITNAYQNAHSNLAQMKRALPARSQFEFQKPSENPQPGLLRMFKENKLLESIFVLLSSPVLSGHPHILSAIRDILQEFLLSQEALLSLLCNPNVINGIEKAILHSVDEAREEGAEESIGQSLGMQIAYYLQALLYVDSLLAYHAKGGLKKEHDDPEVLSVLHHINTMIFSPIGRPAVINVLTMADNLEALLPFVQLSGEEGTDVKQSKSVCACYVTELLMLVVHYSEDIHILEKFSDALYNLSQQEITPKLHDLGLWMAPTRVITSYTYEAVTALMPFLKAHIEDAASLHPELITSLRILQYITIQPSNEADKDMELKYMYAIIQVAANDGMEYLKNILQNVCDTFLKPSHQSSALVGLQGVFVVAIIKPSIFILKSILAHLISSRGTQFKDLTAVPILLKVYSLMLLVPPSSYSYQLSQMVQSEIIEALLSYTQPFLGLEESEEALSKSLWTEMIQEILKFIGLSPSNFLTGLQILSELLPLPLPLQTRETLAEEEIVKMVNYRKLWSAHLHSLNGLIQEVIVDLAATSCHPLQQLLRRVCVQLADLAAPTALFIVRAVLDALFDNLLLPLPDQKENLEPNTSGAHETKPLLKTPTSTTARLLNLVAYLVSHASFKIPLLHVLKGSVKADEKYIDVLTLLLELFNTPSEKTFYIQSQECIVSILQSFCDPEIGFITFENGGSINDVLSSSLPCKEHMSHICGALIQHIGCHTHNYSSLLPTLRTLVMLTEYDYGFYYIKQGLDQHPGAVYSLFTRFSQTFSKDSSDCLSTLSTALEFLRLMENNYEDSTSNGRTLFLSAAELADLLKINNSASDDKEKDIKPPEPFQPVLELTKQLEEFGNDEEAVESLLESISSLLSLLNSAAAKEAKSEKDISEPMLPTPESLSSQFSSRSIFMLGEVEEGRLSPAYWLALPGAEDADQEQEQVAVDLMAIAEKNISPDFNLKTTLESLCLSTEGEGDLKTKKKGISIIGGKRKYAPFINPALVDMNNKKPFIAPMRGRGFNRGTSHSSRANDPFRSRPPNTSRPPSMHVDDFVALESHHSGSGSQAQVKRPQKEGSRGRGRGFERNQVFTSTRGNGGRFFSPPGPYGRRDNNRGGNRGTGRISSNAWNNRSNQNSGQKLSPAGGQRNSFGNHRGDYSSPFNQDTRPGQRNRDPYTEMSRPSNIIPLSRFSRGSRTGSSMGQQSQGHWQDNRNKTQNQRFMTPGSASRGGRREINTRHNRSFTR